MSLLLLDTHVLLWAAGVPDKLSVKARELIEDPRNLPAFSPASLWEVVIKHGLGRSDFRVDPRHLRRGLLDAGYREIPITSEHVLSVSALPNLHKDPFDRILIAQAEVEGAMLLTCDDQIAQYPSTAVHLV
jgi:PIN domain nuclease of toxin-antitoxin system